MITLADYLGHWTASEEEEDAAVVMLRKVNALLDEAEANGVEIPTNPKTHTLVSGEVYGGFRPQDCPIGAPHSAHKEGRAVDVYDPTGALDKWLTDARLAAHGLYREAPSATPTWTHLQDRPTANRTFVP